MSGGIPMGFGFGALPMQMPGAAPGDAVRRGRREQLTPDEQRAAVVRALVGSQVFHPGNRPAPMGGLADMGQDAGQDGGQGGQAPQQAAPGGPADAPQAGQGASLLSALFDRNPMGPAQSFSGTSGGIPASQDDPDAPQQGGPPSALDVGALSSLLGGAAGGQQGGAPAGPQATGAIDPAAPPIAITEADTQRLERQQASPADLSALGLGSAPALLQRAPQQAPQAAGQVAEQEDGEAARPLGLAGLPVPLPPARPAEFGGAGMRPVDSFDPLTGQPVSGSPQTVQPANAFDPLTGQVVSGSPQPVARAAPGGAPGSAAAPGSPSSSVDDHSFLNAWRKLGESGFGDQLIAFGAGMLSGRNFADGAGRGLQNMLAVQSSGSKADMERLDYLLKLKKAQQEQATLTGNANYVKSIFAKNGQEISDEQALTMGGNATVMSEILKGVLPSTEMYKQDTDKDGNTWQTNTRNNQRSLLKGADKEDVQIITDPVTGTVRAVRKSAVFEDKGGAAAGQQGAASQPETADAGEGADPNVRVVFQGSKGFTPLNDPTARLKAGIRQDDNRAAWMGADGKVVFEPSAPQQQAPQIRSIQLADGTKVDREWDPNTRTWVTPNMGANPPAGRDNSDVPPGVDPATFRKEAAKAAVAEQKSNTQRGQQAVSAMPILDRAEQAYGRLAQNGGIGPYQAWGPNRAIGGMLGKQNEIDRQEYEAASKELELLQAQIKMKGQGAITEGERRILQMTLPRLDAASPETGINTLRGMRQQFQKAIDAAGPGVGQAAPQQGGGQPQGQPQARPPAGGPAFRYQQLRRSGMSQADAYAQMQQEGF